MVEKRLVRLVGVIERTLLGAAMGAMLFIVEQRLRQVQRRRARASAPPTTISAAGPR
jgi:hypothetical protein